MGFLIKFILVFVAIYLLMKGFIGFLLGKKTGQSSTFQQNRREQPKQTDRQEERIIEYQKKTFESSDAEDVEFVEIKDHKSDTWIIEATTDNNADYNTNKIDHPSLFKEGVVCLKGGNISPSAVLLFVENNYFCTGGKSFHRK